MQVLWELNTDHFRQDFERLTFRVHKEIKGNPDRLDLWKFHLTCIRRVWGSYLPVFPSYFEDRILDSPDELLQLRH